jgi:hypothetical protein
MKNILSSTLLLSSLLLADFKVGDTLPPIELSDQFDKEFKVETSDTTIVMAFEKDVSITVADYLKSKPSSFLAEHHSKYISDISTMPSMITSMFALPKMRKYPFSVLLINDDFGKQFNRQDGKITIFTLKKGEIKSIKFITSDELPKVF